MDKGWSLALVGGVVGGMVALGLAGLLFWQGRSTPITQRAEGTPAATAPPTPQPMGGGSTGATAQTTPKINQEQSAIALITGLYEALSAKNWAQARLAYTPAMQSQFDPTFFAQFDRVAVQDLRVTERSPDQWQFLGRNTYFYPNGDTQEEERSYTILWQNNRPIISDSRFVRVLQSR
ncbi:heat shock protein 70 [Gloeomargarita lithophora Alchichica-D10]|uniref:Heat shock protein 70 n=1 Tax=Gloeomargarita lithophora Alchichica-D10 TaxID=1188229 RepID=A0A1J0AEM8_9CYAN|nr:hypothetical protein [Gloeomargarita lithophora]APB34368.1 heat shock protein 70 [Gloeomargarita lithophora Alchichica-D10]